MSDRTLRATADLLGEGYEPHEITPCHIIERELRRLINQVTEFELIANNIDRPKADGKYDPRWYTAQGVKTGFHEGLAEVLYDLMACRSLSASGLKCYQSAEHGGWHADGNGVSWDADGVELR